MMNAEVLVVRPPPRASFPPVAMPTTYSVSGRTLSCRNRCAIIWYLLAFWALITIPIVIYFALSRTPSHDNPFKFEVNSLEVYSAQASLDVNVTLSLSVTTHTHPVVIESFLASLAYSDDDKNRNDINHNNNNNNNNNNNVLSSMKNDTLFYLNKTKTMDLSMSTKNINFTRKEDNLELQVIVSGRYSILEKGNQIDRSNFNIFCKGIKGVSSSSPNNVTVSIGRMLGGPLPCK